jgi:hypothetical protein
MASTGKVSGLKLTAVNITDVHMINYRYIKSEVM